MDRVTAQSRAPVVGVARHFIKAYCLVVLIAASINDIILTDGIWLE
jgi:hypothetical protein